MNDFKQKLSEKYLNQFDDLMERVSSTDYNKNAEKIDNIKHMRMIAQYTDLLANKTEANFMDLYSKDLFSASKKDEFAQNEVLKNTDDLLEKQKILFEKGFVSCFNSLKRNAGHIYSDNTIKKCMAVNCGARLERAKDEFAQWSENVQQQSYTQENTNEKIQEFANEN